VLNKMPSEKSGYYRYGYYHRHVAAVPDVDSARPVGA
jgi:hypothetical protein